MKTTLFTCLNACYDVSVDGYEIEETTGYETEGTTDQPGPPSIRLTCDDDNEWEFVDQPVELNRDGQADAVDIGGAVHELQFSVKVPLRLDC
jgi:hypothetical protein